MNIKIFRNALLTISVIALSLGVGYRYGEYRSRQNYTISTNSSIKSIKNSENKETVDFSLFWNVWDKVSKGYVDKKLVDPQKMVYGAISGMVGAVGDPYTVFLNPEQNKESKDDLGGKFEGIGAQLGVEDKKIIVIAPLKGMPAEKAGLKPGDWIMKVDDKETTDMTLPEAVAKIRGPRGSTVTLSILPKGASISSEIRIIRETVKVASVEVEYKKVNCNNSSSENNSCKEDDSCINCPQIAYLKLTRFGDDTTKEWEKAVLDISLKYEKKQISGMVFDLRNNPGGYLSGSVFIASEFIKNKTVVIQENISGKENYDVNRIGKLSEIPLVVLVNKGSASASEIVAGALKHYKRAKLIGEKTFGKGSIQEAIDLPEGTGLHITTSKWLIPGEEWINGKGISPDVEVIWNQSQNKEDIQLIKAYEELLVK